MNGLRITKGSVLVLVLVFAGSDLFGREPRRERPVLVRWAPVEFAWGYRLELKTKSGKRLPPRVTRSTELRFVLLPGDYLFRITALNKFRKSAGSTKWRALKVAAPFPFAWKSLVPGWPLLSRGDAKGFYWLGGLVVPALAALGEFQSAGRTNRALQTQSPANLFDGPAVLALPESLRRDSAAAAPILLASLDAQRRLIAGRDRHIRNYFTLGGLVLLVHALHLYYYHDYGYENSAQSMGPASGSTFEPVFDLRMNVEFRTDVRGIQAGANTAPPNEVVLGVRFRF